MSTARVFRNLLDTSVLWPSDGAISQTTAAWLRDPDVQKALELLPRVECIRIERFRFMDDARMALASCLMKRRAASLHCGRPWSSIEFEQGPHGKPQCAPPRTLHKQDRHYDFNVSHQHSVVVLIGSSHAPIDGIEEVGLGVDLVHIDRTRQDHEIRRHGFENWLAMHDSVFSACERESILQATEASLSVEHARLRAFYALWAHKEAYVKMTGQGLGSMMLQKIEFRGFQTPKISENVAINPWGPTIDVTDIWLDGRPVQPQIRMESQAFLRDYIVVSAASTADVMFEPFHILSSMEDLHPGLVSI